MRPAAARPVSVVVTHFEDQRRLDLVLAALELQTLSADAFEVIVADDGSAAAPHVGQRAYPVRVVRHTDLGNRAGPTRNLGARASAAPTLVFLDGDTVPEPAFLDEITRACDGRHLTVGRRRHADLSTIDVAGVAHWLAGTGPAPPILEEPAWLTEGWARSDDLRQTDLRSYRYIISAVLACPRWLFDRVGGFAEELVGYGGEDWEFARRCWLAGADFRHAPDAIGWHDGPDLGGRPDDVVAVKNAETARIAALLTDPALRGRGLIWPNPRVVARYRLVPETPDAAWVASIEGLLRHGDVGVWVGDAPLPPIADPRVQRGLPAASVLGRSELVLDVTAPVQFDDALLGALQAVTPVHAGGVSAASPRHLALAASAVDIDAARVVDPSVQLERWFESREP